jgi:hypothetical protein
MKNTYNLLKQGTVAFMSIIAIDGYRRAVIRDNKMRESDRLIQDTFKKYESAVKQVEEKQDIIASNETEVVASLGKIKQDLEILNQDTHNLANQVSTNNNQAIETSSKVINKSATSVVDEINKLIDKINRPGSNNSLNNIFDFSSYTTAELGAISHILACISISGCLFNIAIAYYGDYLIIYYKLEEKYPKLAKWIKLRRKFQHYYIGLNIILIFIILLFVLYANYTVLKYK